MDVKLAAQMADKPIILGFGVTVSDSVRALASQSGVTVVSFPIIYSLMDWVVAHCTRLLPPQIVYDEKASLTVLQVFTITAHGGDKVKIAGCSVNKGKVRRGADVHVKHDDAVVFRGKIRQLRHHKEEVKEISAGKECGVMFSEGWEDFHEGDIISVVEPRPVPRQFLKPSK